MNEKITKLLSLILAVVLCFSVCSPVVFATETQEDLERQIADLDEKIAEKQDELDSIQGDMADQKKVISNLNEQINDMESQMKLIQTKVDSISADVNETNQKIESKNEEISKQQKKIDEVQSKIAKQEEEIKKTVQLLCERLRSVYLTGNSSTIELLLSCDDISSFLITSEILKRLAEYDDNLVKEINKIIKSLKKMNDELEEDKKELLDAKAELDAQKGILMSKLSEQQEEMAKFKVKQDEITQKIGQSQAILKDLDETSEAYRLAIENFEEQQAAAESRIQEIIRGSSVVDPPSGGGESGGGGGGSSSGGYICPVPYGDRYVSSYFGYRESFLTDSGQYTGTFHGGTDITCSGGWNYDKKILASRAGTVICAEWLSGYGNTVMIQHSDGYVTLYAHNYCFTCSYGQYVEQGQQIAIMGSTGNSTGPHCHFEIRDPYGQQLDALNFITV